MLLWLLNMGFAGGGAFTPPFSAVLTSSEPDAVLTDAGPNAVLTDAGPDAVGSC